MLNIVRKTRRNRWAARGKVAAASASGRRAFTLLELLLALALAAIVLFLINMAVELHLKSLDSRRTQLEEAQLARSVMRVIADDVRAVVQAYKQDVSGVEAMLQQAAPTAMSSLASGGETSGQSTGQTSGQSTGQTSGQSSGQTSGQTSSQSSNQSSTQNSSQGSSQSSGQTGGATGISGASGTLSPSNTGASGSSTSSSSTSSSGTGTEESVASSDLSTVTVTDIPGIFGNQYQLQMDVSRLPRPEEYQPIMSDDPTVTLPDIPSDVKTVTYYLKTAESNVTTVTMLSNATPLTSLSDPNNYATGLVRRELDRSITSWANESGNLSGLESSDEVIAPEVVSLEFRYFDGSEWLTEWDTSEEEMLPFAIQVILGITHSVRTTTPTPTTVTTTELTENVRYYTMVIQLPTGGQPASTGSPSSETSETTESSGTSPTSGIGSTSTSGAMP